MPAVRSVCRWRSTSRIRRRSCRLMGTTSGTRSCEHHPDWSFAGKDFSTDAQLLEARDRVLARHPKTTFIGLHVGHSSENLGAASQALDRFPNLHVEIAARIGELGRQPRASRRFFNKSRIGSCSAPTACATRCTRSLPVPGNGRRYFEYGPGPVSAQGRWRIYGVGLPDQVLRKVYRRTRSGCSRSEPAGERVDGLRGRPDVCRRRWLIWRGSR